MFFGWSETIKSNLNTIHSGCLRPKCCPCYHSCIWKEAVRSAPADPRSGQSVQAAGGMKRRRRKSSMFSDHPSQSCLGSQISPLKFLMDLHQLSAKWLVVKYILHVFAGGWISDNTEKLYPGSWLGSNFNFRQTSNQVCIVGRGASGRVAFECSGKSTERKRTQKIKTQQEVNQYRKHNKGSVPQDCSFSSSNGKFT